MKTFEITKEQIIKLHKNEGSKYVKEWFPDAFKPELEVEKWYKDIRHNSKALFYLEKIINHETNGMKSYGFTINGDWTESCNRSNDVFQKFTEEATPQEVETALINEAKKRGFNVYGAYIESTQGICGNITGGRYVYSSNKLYYSGFVIFDNGQWAEIIETITKEEAKQERSYSELVDLLERITPIYKEDSDLHEKYDKKRLEFIKQFKKLL